MHDALHRLYRTKLTLMAAILLFGGLVLLVFGHWVIRSSTWRWLANWPLIDIGSGLFTTGLLGVAWQYVDGKDGEARDTERLRRVLGESAPAMRDAVIEGFAFQPADIARVSTPETLDQIITNGLAIRLGDAGFAAEVYDDVRRQAIGSPERLHDVRVSIRLSPLSMDRGTAKGRADFFAVTMRWEYKLVPTYAIRRFVCTSDIREFHELDEDNAGVAVWYLTNKPGLKASDQHAFELLEFTVDGQPRIIRRSAKADSQTYSVDLGRHAIDEGRLVTVEYTYRTVVSASGHRLRLRVDQPTKGLAVELDYGDTDIAEIAVLDYIASGGRTRIGRSPVALAEKSVTIEFDGWVFPRSGVAFVWTYDADRRRA